MNDSNTYEFGARVTATDVASAVFTGIGDHWEKMIKRLQIMPDDAAWINSLTKRAAIGTVIAATSVTALMNVTSSMLDARVRVEELTGDIRTLGATSADIQKIESATTLMAAKLGLSQERLLTGIYDIKSAVSTLGNDTLPEFADAIARTAVATKGEFEDLSKTFGMVYNQFAHRYKHLSEVEFARNLGNNITWAANKFRADGQTINQAFTSLGSSAAAAGYTLEEQTAVIGRLLNTMVPETAGTSFRTFIDKMDVGLQKLGISKIDPVTKQLRTIPDLIDAINAKNPSTQVLEKAFTSEGLKMIRELSPHTAAMREDLQEISSASVGKNWKFLDDAATTKLNTLPVSLRRIREGFAAIWGQMSAAASPLGTIIGHLADVVEGVASFAATHPTIARYTGTVILLGLAMGTLVGVVMAARSAYQIYTIIQYANALAMAASASATGAATTASGAYAIGLGLTTASLSAAAASAWAFTVALLANPITWIVIGIVALIAGIAALIIYWDKVKETAVGAWTWIKAKWDGAPSWARGLGLLMFIALTGGLGLIVIVAVKYWDQISAAGIAAWTWIEEVWDAGVAFFVGLWNGISSGAVTAFTTVTNLWDMLPGWAKALITLLSPFIGLPLLIASNWAELKGMLGDLMEGNFQGIFARLDSIGTRAGLGFMKALIKGILSGAGELVGAVKGFLEAVDRNLAHSDAKEGPLSRLTQSGRSIPATLALGVRSGTPLLSAATERMARDVMTPDVVRDVVAAPAGRSSGGHGLSVGSVNVTVQNDPGQTRKERVARLSNALAEEFWDELDRMGVPA